MSGTSDDDSEQDMVVVIDSSDDGYSDDGFEYRHYANPLMYYVPKESRSAVRKLAKDTARVFANQEPIKRVVHHFSTDQEKPETCMQENCNQLTSTKCGRCHVFLCTDSENCCFKKFHDNEV